MTMNPYTSPAADLQITPAGAATKPISWWIMQVIMVVATPALVMYGAMMGLYAHDNTPRGDGTAGFIVFAVMLAFALWALSIVITTYRRMPLARWLGGAFIALMMLSGLSTVLSIFGATDNSTAFRFGQFVGAGMVLALEAYWLYTFALSPKTRRYVGLE